MIRLKLTGICSDAESQSLATNGPNIEAQILLWLHSSIESQYLLFNRSYNTKQLIRCVILIQLWHVKQLNPLDVTLYEKVWELFIFRDSSLLHGQLQDYCRFCLKDITVSVITFRNMKKPCSQCNLQFLTINTLCFMWMFTLIGS